jgi:hypothetical protein
VRGVSTVPGACLWQPSLPGPLPRKRGKGRIRSRFGTCRGFPLSQPRVHPPLDGVRIRIEPLRLRISDAS